ncbi:hypothetical protein Pen02_40200 [Plantactinospora endophytica]|uniref:Uncharacterized protein n=1 Tax=Plantactinospora endophytica TaxID=673535 RepID=A0ABQ4E2Z6_9ACTN|nr:hypothetical protein Pen02_40200 [Plantactinospora endophytica]
MHMEPTNHAVPDLGRDPLQQRRRQQSELGRPRGRLRLDREFAVLQLHRTAVLGDVRAHHPLPGAEDGGLGGRLLPAPGLHQPGQHRTEELWITRVGPGAGVAARPTPLSARPTRGTGTAGRTVGRRLRVRIGSAGGTPTRAGRLSSGECRVEYRPGQCRTGQVTVAGRRPRTGLPSGRSLPGRARRGVLLPAAGRSTRRR